MNNRLTIQELAGLLADYTGKDANSSELFLREFIAVVSEGVYTDKLVKVKGLGTFKIILVEKRESIHVNTGERFVIPGHYKFSFLPDKELRELVNKPFSFFETNELGENVDFTDMDVVADETETKEAEDESTEEMILEERCLLEDEHLLRGEEMVIPSEEKLAISPEGTSVGQSESVGEETSELVVDESPDECRPESPVEEEKAGSDVERKKKHAKRIPLLVIFVFFLVLFNIGLYLNRFHFFGADEKTPVLKEGPVVSTEEDTLLFEPEEAGEQELVTQTDSSTVVIDTTSVPVGREAPPFMEEIAEVRPEAVSSPVIARVKIERGSRLTLISLKYYGSKLFWVYLYEYNKAIIKDPNNVPIGTTIEVPAPEVYGIDCRDRSSVEKAAARQTEILSGRL